MRVEFEPMSMTATLCGATARSKRKSAPLEDAAIGSSAARWASWSVSAIAIDSTDWTSFQTP